MCSGATALWCCFCCRRYFFIHTHTHRLLSHSYAIMVNRLRWKSREWKKREASRGQNVKMYQHFSMLFSCLLSFGFIFVMFLLFNLIQILICHVFLFICFFFSLLYIFIFISFYVPSDRDCRGHCATQYSKYLPKKKNWRKLLIFVWNGWHFVLSLLFI